MPKIEAVGAKRLVLTTGAQCRPLWLSYLFTVPSVILFGTVGYAIAIKIRSDPEEAMRIVKSLPIIVLAGAAALPFALWRNWFTLDRESSRLFHDWGYPFWRFGSREYDLRSFTAVCVEGVRPYWTTAGGRVTPPMIDGFVNTGHRLYYDVSLVGKKTLLLQEFHSFAGAMDARRRVADFLGLPCEAAPVRKTPIGPNLHAALYFLAMPIFMIGGLALLLAVAPWIAATAKSLENYFGMKNIAALALIAGFVLFPIAAISAGAALVSLLPAACPRCGGKARLVWSTRWAPGISFGRYHCLGCGDSWTPLA